SRRRSRCSSPIRSCTAIRWEYSTSRHHRCSSSNPALECMRRPPRDKRQCPVASHNPLQQSASVVHPAPFNPQIYPVSQRHWPLKVSKGQAEEPKGQLPPQELAEERPHAGSGAQAHWTPAPRTKTQPSLGPQPVQLAQNCGVVDVVVVPCGRDR